MCYFNTHRLVYYCLIMLWATASSGCATNPDPHQGGFINGFAGLSGGVYQNRLDTRTAQYHNELRTGDQLKSEVAALEIERAQLNSSLEQAQQRLTQLEQRIAQEQAALANQRRQQQAAVAAAAAQARQARLAQAQAQVVRTKRQLTTLRPRIPTATAPTVATLKQQSQALQQELNAIDELVGVIAG